MRWGWGEAYFPGFPPRSGLMLFPPLMSYLNTYIHITTSFCQATLQDQAQSPLMPSLTSPGEWQGPPLSPACLRLLPTLTCLPHKPVDSEGRMWVLGAQHRARYRARAGKHLVNSGGKRQRGPFLLSQPLAQHASLATGFCPGSGQVWREGKSWPAPLPRAQHDINNSQGGCQRDWILPGAELAPPCPAGPASPWPSSTASALWTRPSPFPSAQASGDVCVHVCAHG